MGECGELSMLSGISRSKPNCWMELGMSCNGNEKVNEKPLCIEKEIDGNEGEVSGNVDLIDEYPPLCRGWVDRPFDDRVNEEKSENEASTKAFRCFLVKIPSLDDQILKEQSRLAELHLDDKTSFRESIQLQIQTRIQNNEFEHAVDEVKSARELVKLKRKEIDSHRSVVRVVKNALSFDDMDSQEAFEQQLEYLKILKKDLDILKASVVRAENAAAAAQRKNHDQVKKVKELEARFRVANDACQAAYAQLTSLRTQHREKMRQFFGYRDEATAASNHAYSRNCEAPDRLCKNQVERFMKMWNKNSMFRQDYVNSNAKSTIRRFGTLDGCSLGPDEKPHMLPQHVYVPVVNTEEKENREENEQGISGKDVSNEVTREAEESEMKEAEAEAELEAQKVELLEMGEELKAQMEAEKREKKRHKRLRLKERKKAARLGPSEEPPMLPENSEDHQMEENEHVPENSEQLTSLKENEQVSDEFKERHDLEENEQVPDNQTSEASKMKEGEDELKEDVQLQGQTEADQREKKRQKRLRNKERKKVAREGRSAVGQRVDSETPELQNRNPEMPSDADHVENQQVVNEETPEPYVSNPEMQRDADEKRDQNQQPCATLTHPKDPNEEENKQEEEEENKQDPKEEEDEENKQDPKEEENKQEQEEEVTMQVIEQPREALMAQMRAEIKAQLEAEIRDKKKAKKLRRKERNKEAKEAAATHGRNRKTFIWVVIFILMITLILFLTHFDFNFTSILWS